MSADRPGREGEPRPRAIADAIYGRTYGYLAGLPHAFMVYGTGWHDVMPPVPLNVFAVKAGGTVVLFDAGSTATWAARKRVQDYVDPLELLRRVEIGPAQVDHVVISHLHWDHATNVAAYPRATVHLQRSELEGWRAALGWGEEFRWVYRGRVERDLIDWLAGSERVRLADGDAEVVPGIRCHLAPGHTFGTQFLSVEAAKGRVVLASDVVYLYENLERMLPLGNGLDQVEMLRSFVKARESASPNLVVPGHDPTTVDRFELLEPRVLRIA